MKHVVVWILIPLAAAAGFTWYFVYAANPLTGFWQTAYAEHHASLLARFPHQPGRYTVIPPHQGQEQFSTQVFHHPVLGATRSFPHGATLLVVFQEKWVLHGNPRLGTYEVVLGTANRVLAAKVTGSFSSSSYKDIGLGPAS